MIELRNETLSIDILDPVKDRHLLGTRYCWGGYIWQVSDNQKGPLLSGPDYPSPKPLAFNGQGLPEVLRHSVLFSGKPLTWEKDEGLIMGVGRVQRVGKDDPKTPEPEGLTITEPAPWIIEQWENEIIFSTQGSFEKWVYQLERRISLNGRVITSETTLKNKGQETLPLHWFAHPFFAYTDGFATCKFHSPISMKDNVGFHLSSGLFSTKKRFIGEDNHFEMMELPEETNLDVTISHPLIQDIRFSTNFALSMLPIWAGEATISIEPYMVTEISPGKEKKWKLTYQFGTP
jgi:hypothetical protein